MPEPKWVDVVLDFLLHEEGASSVPVPGDYAGKRSLLRALMNVRPARPVPRPILEAQDQLLRAEREEKGIVLMHKLPTVDKVFPQCGLRHTDTLCLWRGDITRLAFGDAGKGGAIVNAANSLMQGCWLPLHECIDNAIHSAAGMQLRQECHDMMLADYPSGRWEEPTGSARITHAYNLPCAHVIHTVGPIVDGPLTELHRKLLASSYQSCLEVAAKAHCGSLAFCSISTGEFRFPKPDAARIALDTTLRFLDEHPGSLDRIVFDVFSEADENIYRALFEGEQT